MEKKYANIVFGLPIEGPFDYFIPGGLRGHVQFGARVLVPFRDKKKVGYCVGLSGKSKIRYTKEIISALDTQPLLSRRFLAFLSEVAEVYFSSWGEMIESALPAYLRKGRKENAELLNSVMGNNPQDLPKMDEAVLGETKAIVDAVEKEEHKIFSLCDDYLEPKKVSIFLELSKAVLKQAKDVLIIVPELSTAQELIRAFKVSFAESVLVYHSHLSEKELYRSWLLMREESPKITIGTRMAVFHPKEPIGLIIVDDEGALSHKQDESPFYNARDVALMRAKFFKIPLVLSGSPVSVETYYKAQKNKAALIDLRTKHKNFPQILVVDSGMLRNNLYISKPLELKISQALNEGRKIVLFFNRRGFSTLVKCFKCGRTVRCRRCAQNLTYHFASKKLICHSCGYRANVLALCPECNSSYLRYLGMGTEKLESELSRIFPQARIARLDLDVKNSEMLENVLKDFQNKRVDILIGTSLLAKGLPLLDIALLGIINLEQGLNLTDFRGGERLFALLLGLTKLLYGKNSWGQLVIQTYNPENSLVKALLRFDYDLFYKEEIKTRRDLKLPPFGNLIILNLREKSRQAAENNARQLSQDLNKLNRNENIFVSEALPHPLFKLRDKYRWQIIIKSRNIKAVYKMLKTAVGAKRRFKGSILTVDVELA